MDLYLYYFAAGRYRERGLVALRAMQTCSATGLRVNASLPRLYKKVLEYDLRGKVNRCFNVVIFNPVL